MFLNAFFNRNFFSELLLLLLLLLLLVLNLLNSVLERSCCVSIFLITISLNPQSLCFPPTVEVQCLVRLSI